MYGSPPQGTDFEQKGFFLAGKQLRVFGVNLWEFSPLRLFKLGFVVVSVFGVSFGPFVAMVRIHVLLRRFEMVDFAIEKRFNNNNTDDDNNNNNNNNELAKLTQSNNNDNDNNDNNNNNNNIDDVSTFLQNAFLLMIIIYAIFFQVSAAAGTYLIIGLLLWAIISVRRLFGAGWLLKTFTIFSNTFSILKFVLYQQNREER